MIVFVTKGKLERMSKGPSWGELLVMLAIALLIGGSAAWLLYRAADVYLTIQGIPH